MVTKESRGNGTVIIGILGKAGSGKNTASKVLANLNYDHWAFCKETAFADPIKDLCSKLFGFTYQQLWGPSQNRNQPSPLYKDKPELTARIALQRIGDIGRELCPSVWIDKVFENIKDLKGRGYQRFVITDVRMPDEVEAISKHNGLLLKLVRSYAKPEEKSEWTNHPTETNQDTIPDDAFNKIIDVPEGTEEFRKIVENWAHTTGWVITPVKRKR